MTSTCTDDDEESLSTEERRKLWRPAKRLTTVTRADAEAVLAHWRERGLARQEAYELAQKPRIKGENRAVDPDDVRHYLVMVRALRRGGQFTFAEYVFRVSQRIEMVVDDRIMNGSYAAELDPISEAMEAIEAEHGLTANEYWHLDDAPDEYQALSDQWSAVTASKLPEVLAEFGESELADLAAQDRQRYDALREEGRLAVYETENVEAALVSLILHYEHEAQTTLDAGAYLASCLMWGAAAEARLLLRCLREPARAAEARTTLTVSKRPRRDDPTGWTLEQLVLVAAKAGWLGTLEDDLFTYYVDGLVEHLRSLRNLIHPGRHVNERPHLLLDLAAAHDARAAYLALCLRESEPLAADG